MVHGCGPVKTVRGRVTEWEELARIANAIVKEQSANVLSRRVARRTEHRETEGDMQAAYWIQCGVRAIVNDHERLESIKRARWWRSIKKDKSMSTFPTEHAIRKFVLRHQLSPEERRLWVSAETACIFHLKANC